MRNNKSHTNLIVIGQVTGYDGDEIPTIGGSLLIVPVIRKG